MATITKRASGKFRCQIRQVGKSSYSRTFNTKKEARQWAREMEKGQVQVPTLDEALTRYENEFTPLKKNAYKERCIIRKWQKHPLAKLTLDNISAKDMVEWRNARREKAPSTLQHFVSLITQVYKVAGSEWHIEGLSNPCAGLKLPKNRPARERRLLPGEFERIYEALSACCTPNVETIFAVAVQTGCRQGELLAIEWKHVNLDRRIISLEAHMTKTNRARAVPLSSKAVEALQGLDMDTMKVFDLKRTTLCRAWSKCLDELGITDLHFHDLRREALSRMLEKGIGPYQVARISGHGDIKMLMRYAQFHAEDLVALMD